MVNVALFVRLETKPGKEAEVAELQKGGLAIVEMEPATIAWFGSRPGLYPNSKVRDIREPRFQGRKLADPD